MKQYFANTKEKITEYLNNHLKSYSEDKIVKACSRFHVLQKIVDFSSRSKMIRGSLVSFGASLFNENYNKDSAIRCGAALELLQSSVIIHDDIMDNDQMRRGHDSIFYHYFKEASKEGIQRAYHTGLSMGICVGDISFSLAFEILNRIDLDTSIKSSIFGLVSREMSYVGLAQMNDVWSSVAYKVSKEEDILNLYRFKTGRHSFSLPLMMGAYLAGEDGYIIDKLGEIGEILGILFQIKDDELGLLGNEFKLGKPIGSDIIGGKKTIFYHYLIETINDEEKDKLSLIYGNLDARDEDIKYVLSLFAKYNIYEVVSEKSEEIYNHLLDLISSIDKINDTGKDQLKKLYVYNFEREA